MKRFFTKRSWWALIGLVAVAMAAFIHPVEAEKRTTRKGPEVQVGGLTITEQAVVRKEMHDRVSKLVPKGADKSPLLIEITEQDRIDLSEPAASGFAPLRIGVVKAIGDPVGKPYGKAFNHGVKKEYTDGSFTWGMTVKSPGAQAIRIHFTGFSLPDNTEMYLLGDNGQAHGPYTGRGRNGNGDFWTRSIVGKSGRVVLHYTGGTPDIDRPDMSFQITDVGHINGRYRGQGRGKPPRPVEQSHDSWPCSDNASCVVDANCVNGTPADVAKDAVAKMEWITGQFINTCTGGLLADTDGSSQIPYFLTANHCLSSNTSNMETFFFYQTSTCNGSCPDGLVTGGSPPPASTIGYTVLETSNQGDFTLGTIDQAPPGGTTFLGWNNSPIAFTPGAALYRVSNANFGPQVYSQHDVNTTSQTCTGWERGERIYSDDQTGATMGGSSGSPVLNATSDVVGQLSGCCGFNCGNECDSVNNRTVDGALAFYWSTVEYLLDPVPGCTTDLECDDGQFCTGTETCVSGSCQSSGDPCSGGTVCNEATNSCDAPVCDNDGACEAGEDCNNCPNDCRQKTNGNPNGRYCCDGDLTDCGDTRCNESGWSCGSGGGCTTNADCDDGQFCNGAEICSGGSCQSGSDPCPGQGCDETNNVCVSCGGNKASCSSNSDCCSNNCRGSSCRGN